MCSTPHYTDLTYMEGTGFGGPMKTIFCIVIQSWYTSVNIKFAVNRMFHVLKSPVYRFDLYGGTGSGRRMRIMFGKVIQSWYTSLNIKFGVNPMLHVLKSAVYRPDLYGRYRTLWTLDDIFWQWCLELAYKPKYEIWCQSDIACAQVPSIPI